MWTQTEFFFFLGQVVFSDSILNAPKQLDRIRDSFSSISETEHLSSGNYIELQFHGGASADDIGYISLSKDAKAAKNG